MARINENYDKLQGGYLFQEVARRTKRFQEQNPGVEILKLGIGNTVLPLAPKVAEGLRKGVEDLCSIETYAGYGDEQGNSELRAALARRYAKRGASIDPLEILVSDGAKPDSGNIQSIFRIENVVAIQNPAYPVYVDTNVIAGRGDKIIYMPCTEENRFFPELPNKADLIYICSPNNPTGGVATKKQLKFFVDYAIDNKAVLIFDAAYGAFIRSDSLPRTIYEVDGAKECVIEINSFSKYAGFTGVRLGWTVVPFELNSAEFGKINALWDRRQTTFFNGASNIAQAGGLAALTEQGEEECQWTIDYYMKNASIIKTGVEGLGFKAFGGENAPYIWMKTPNRMPSWSFFDKLLNEAHVVATPGSGFGSCGEYYMRLSAFGIRENIEKAVEAMQNLNL